MLNIDHLNKPGGNVSNLQLNPDGSIRNLNGYTRSRVRTETRQLRVGVRVGW